MGCSTNISGLGKNGQCLPKGPLLVEVIVGTLKALLDPHRNVYAARGLEARISLAIEGLEQHVAATDSR